jgi:ABC-type lipoprotein export system ATPase subunit
MPGVRSANKREQQIAVFGESGSGKTVLLSSFYGPAQESSLDSESSFDLIADDTAQVCAFIRTTSV